MVQGEFNPAVLAVGIKNFLESVKEKNRMIWVNKLVESDTLIQMGIY